MKKVVCSQAEVLTAEELEIVNGGRRWDRIARGCGSNARREKKKMDRAREWDRNRRNNERNSSRTGGCNSRA
ncbi:hypothetical protein [Vibrio vulnificus]|uniref:hypothetical protein n=1 Tax=Vibrio vulnificus TaxID=672 RepID=UPI001CDC9FDC|nr:hypothetical protein [Vibrio vulnificus]EHD0092626.1 hypothetical protein [Vibrio vulnificus]EIT6976703.1 hypothetical protein [Vibrio vulnificus]EIZ1362002.1 hypothetical protein [Vibrio vulnificus]ELG5189596.1 hypothetical protein [Vibrio vulnificus]MCA3904980.1 hypothetical protein [Vibrio vulnificus]